MKDDDIIPFNLIVIAYVKNIGVSGCNVKTQSIYKLI